MIAPLDHGVMEGMLSGLEELPRLLEMVGEFPVQGIMLNKGALRVHLQDIPLSVMAVAQLSGGTRHCLPPYARSLMCSATEGLRLGADMVAVQVNIANELEDRMLADFGAIVDEAHGLFKITDAPAQTAAEIGNFAWTKNDEGDHQDKNQMVRFE